LLGPWGWIKAWANLETLPHWALYAAGFLVINLVLLPGFFWLTARLARRFGRQPMPMRQVFIDYAYALIPLGLAAWISFSFGFVLVNGSYALAVISDPFGWGWNLFGTANIPWTPILPTLVNFLQIGALTVGLLFAVNVAHRIARQHVADTRRAFRAMLPVTGFMVGLTLIFVWLYMG
jgi:hypothetical protein